MLWNSSWSPNSTERHSILKYFIFDLQPQVSNDYSLSMNTFPPTLSRQTNQFKITTLFTVTWRGSLRNAPEQRTVLKRVIAHFLWPSDWVSILNKGHSLLWNMTYFIYLIWYQLQPQNDDYLLCALVCQWTGGNCAFPMNPENKKHHHFTAKCPPST